LDLWQFIGIAAGVLLAALLALFLLRRGKKEPDAPLEVEENETEELPGVNEEIDQHDFVNPLMDEGDLPDSDGSIGPLEDEML
jgi:hypothetical protein